MTRPFCFAAAFAPIFMAASVASASGEHFTWNGADIGVVSVKGEQSVRGSSYVIKGAGTTQSAGDGFHFMFAAVDGDVELSARLEAVLGREGWRAGLMARASDAPDAAQLSLLQTSDGEAVLQYRKRAGEAVVATRVPRPRQEHWSWLSLVRRGTHIVARCSRDGQTWEEVFSVQGNFPSRSLFGLAVTTAIPGTLATADFQDVTVRGPSSGRPASLPGTVEAEAFDVGGEGLTYHRATDEEHRRRQEVKERDPGRSTTEAVPVRPTLAGDGYYVEHGGPGSWIEYTVSVAREDTYRVEARVASMSCGGIVHIELDGLDVSGAMAVPNTGSPDSNWQVVAGHEVRVSSGDHRFRLATDAAGPGGLSVDWIRWTSVVRSGAGFDSAKASSESGPKAFLKPHPRLFVTDARLAELRSTIRLPGSFAQEAFASMKSRVDRRDWRPYARGPADNDTVGAHGRLAREAAFIYLVTGDPQYAESAFVNLSVNSGDGSTSEPASPPRGAWWLGDAAVDLALVYDWCYQAWSTSQRDEIRRRLLADLDAWPCVGDEVLRAPYRLAAGARARSAELIALIAADEDGSRAERYAEVKDLLSQTLATGFGTTGFSPIGLRNAWQAGLALAMAAAASQSINDLDLAAAFDEKAWWRLFTLATPLDPDTAGLRVGRDPEVGVGEAGWASLLLHSVPEKELPTYLWFYNRLVGQSGSSENAVAQPAFEGRNGGTIWALLYHPQSTVERAPDPRSARVLADQEHGAVLYRNRWQDANDTLVSVLASAAATPRDSDGLVPETFDLNIVASGHRFAESQGAVTAAPRLLSTLLVDGQAYKSRTDSGRLDALSDSSSGAYAVIDGGTKYGNLGLKSAERHVLIDSAPGRGDTLVVALDRVDADASHVYTWQLHYGADRGNAGILAAEASEDGVPVFVLRASDGAYLKGWVLTPSAIVVADEPLQVSVQAAKADIWIPMVIGKGDPPSGRVKGTGLSASLEVAGRVVTFDAKKNRIVVSKSS